MEWHFRQYSMGEPTRDPINGEFFSTEAITHPAQALVREGIQNSLDARQGKSATVKISLAIGAHALSPERASRWFEGAWPHFHATGNGLQEPPDRDTSCAYLVFEDFGTKGLQGDETQPFDSRVDNSFFYFFRAEGRSGKSEKDLGRWGVGKQVFPRLSRANMLFGLTIRADDGRRLLMGRSVLKSHLVDGTNFSPDGYFGIRRSDGLILPISDVDTLDRFCTDFEISRKSNEAGLSVVVPFVDEEITMQRLKDAVVTDYFYAIITGTLTVVLATPDGELTIDSHTLEQAASELAEKRANIALSKIELARWAVQNAEENFVRLNPCSPDRPVWSDDLLPIGSAPQMRDSLSKGDKLSVRVELTVKEKNRPPQPSFFDVHLWQDGFEDGRPVFVREGIIISDIHAPLTRFVRSLVVIEDRPLAKLLGDSENPAHTQWQKDSSNFKGKYIYGSSYIDFVTRIVSTLFNALSAEDEQEDRNVLQDVFSLPVEESEDATKRPGQTIGPKEGNKSGLVIDHLPSNQTWFKVIKTRGGFEIVPTNKEMMLPMWLNIKCAYDVRRGNPFAKYESALRAQTPDFRIGQGGVRATAKVGVKILEQRNNHLRVKVTDPDFRLVVKGFDENRDLIVNAKSVESNND